MAQWLSTRVPVAVQVEAMVCRLVHQVNDVWPCETEVVVRRWFQGVQRVQRCLEEAGWWCVLQVVRLCLVAVLVALGQRERPLYGRRRVGVPSKAPSVAQEPRREPELVPEPVAVPEAMQEPVTGPVVDLAVAEAHSQPGASWTSLDPLCGPEMQAAFGPVVPAQEPEPRHVSKAKSRVAAIEASAKAKRSRKPKAVPMPAAAQRTAPAKAAPAKLAELRQRIDQGDSVRAAAKGVGIAESTARSWLKRYPA